MDESIDDVKRRLARKYLGRCGIHGMGVRRSHSSICVYVHSDPSKEQTSILEEISRDAAPYKLMIIREQAPKTTC